MTCVEVSPEKAQRQYLGSRVPNLTNMAGSLIVFPMTEFEDPITPVIGSSREMETA